MLLQTLSRPTPFLTRTRPLLIAFGLSIPLFSPRPVTTLDASPASSASFSSSPYTNSRDARTPLTKDGRTLNPAAVKQISLGSILGLGAGLLLSAFSRSLTLLLGLGIVVWQVRFPTNPSGSSVSPLSPSQFANENEANQYVQAVRSEERLQLHPRRAITGLCAGCQSQECDQR